MDLSFLLLVVLGLTSFSFVAPQTIMAQQQGVDVLPDVTSNISLICILDLPTIIGVPCEPPKKPEPKPKLSIEEKLTNITNGNWKKYTNDDCGVTIEYPENFITSEKYSRFQKTPDFIIKATDPFIFLAASCMEHEIPISSLSQDIDYVKSLTKSDPDNSIIEDTNFTKWSPDNLRAASFVSASYSENDYPVTAVEKFLIRGNSSDLLMHFQTRGMEFDIPEMQEIEKRMINSIHFLNI